MSIHRKAAKRDQNESDIIAALRQVGASVSPISAEGVPDLLVGFRGRTYLLETKFKRGKLTPAQEKWHAEWQGRRAIVVRTIDDALLAIGAIE